MIDRAGVAEEPVPISPSVDPRLVGIRGWLVLHAIGLVLIPLLCAVSLITLLVMSSGLLRGGGSTDLVFVLAGLGGLTLFSTYVAIRFFKKKRNVPTILITVMLLGIGVSILTYVVETHSGKRDEALVRLAIQGLSAAIWIPYFMVSKRVKATFVN